MTDSRVRRGTNPLNYSYSDQNVNLRLAADPDKRAALLIDDGYTTGAMWQPYDHATAMSITGMHVESVPGAEIGFGVAFLPVRLPRPRRIEGLRTSRDAAQRASSWAAADCVMVVAPRRDGPIPDEFAIMAGAPPAEYAVPTPREIWGYAVLSAVRTRRVAWLAELAVSEEHRRHGLGTMLVQAAAAWARAPESHGGAGGMVALMVELSPRNSPGIEFCRARGFAFCGYTDYSRSGGDTTLLFSRAIG